MVIPRVFSGSSGFNAAIHGLNSLGSVPPFLRGLLKDAKPEEVVAAAVGVLTGHEAELSTIGNLVRQVGDVVADESEKPIERRAFRGSSVGLGGLLLTQTFPYTSEPRVGIDGVVRRTTTTTEDVQIVDGKLVTEKTVNTKTVTDPKEQAARIRASAGQVSDFITALGKGEIKIGSLVIKPDEIITLFELLQEILGKGQTVDMDELFGGKNSTTNSSSETGAPPNPNPASPESPTT